MTEPTGISLDADRHVYESRMALGPAHRCRLIHALHPGRVHDHSYPENLLSIACTIETRGKEHPRSSGQIGEYKTNLRRKGGVLAVSLA